MKRQKSTSTARHFASGTVAEAVASPETYKLCRRSLAEFMATDFPRPPLSQRPPYGKWTCDDGREVLFDAPIVRSTAGSQDSAPKSLTRTNGLMASSSKSIFGSMASSNQTALQLPGAGSTQSLRRGGCHDSASAFQAPNHCPSPPTAFLHAGDRNASLASETRLSCF
jgi:hypothetical protein